MRSSGRLRAAGLGPGRQHDQQPRARPLVRVRVPRHIEAVRARRLDEADHPLGRSGVRRAVVEVRDVDRALAPPPDLEGLARTGRGSGRRARSEHACGRSRRSARPRAVSAASSVGGGERARRVVEPRREAERALLHRLAQQPAHPVERGFVGGHVVPAERVDAQRRVADEQAEVDAHAPVEPSEVGLDAAPVERDVGQPVEAGVEAGEVAQRVGRAERRVRVAVDADDLGRDALADLGLVARLGQDHQARVRVRGR